MNNPFFHIDVFTGSVAITGHAVQHMAGDIEV